MSTRLVVGRTRSVVVVVLIHAIVSWRVFMQSRSQGPRGSFSLVKYCNESRSYWSHACISIVKRLRIQEMVLVLC